MIVTRFFFVILKASLFTRLVVLSILEIENQYESKKLEEPYTIEKSIQL